MISDFKEIQSNTDYLKKIWKHNDQVSIHCREHYLIDGLKFPIDQVNTHLRKLHAFGKRLSLKISTSQRLNVLSGIAIFVFIVSRSIFDSWTHMSTLSAQNIRRKEEKAEKKGRLSINVIGEFKSRLIFKIKQVWVGQCYRPMLRQLGIRPIRIKNGIVVNWIRAQENRNRDDWPTWRNWLQKVEFVSRRGEEDQRTTDYLERRKRNRREIYREKQW